MYEYPSIIDENMYGYSYMYDRVKTRLQIITTTPDLNMADVIRVKYVPYSYTVETDNTDANVGVATDPGYDITQPVTDFNLEAMAGGGAQTLVSRGEYSQFKDVYIDGKKRQQSGNQKSQ